MVSYHLSVKHDLTGMHWLVNRSLHDTSEHSSDSMSEEHARMSHDVTAD